jgi:BirA family biotin operon repressor/biotin-[acetyl-CoA-carboxylase] ligase
MKGPANCILPVCTSTNDVARTLVEEGHEEGTWISAETQTAGRGRGGNVWLSARGNLFLSVLVEDCALRSWVPLVAAVSVLKTAEEFGVADKLAIKWPNDLVMRLDDCSFAKVAGVLCERVGRFIIVGLGVNCAEAPRVDGVRTATLGVSVENYRRRLLAKLLENVARLRMDGAAWVRDIYMRKAAFSAGERVTWQDADGGSHNGEVIGLGEQGELRVQENGIARGLFSGEVRLFRSGVC